MATTRTSTTGSTPPGASEHGWRVGELAELTGVTVRTLRHYDQSGLLQPSGRTAGGYRLYDPDNVARLYRILALRRLRFGLADIRALLDDPEWDMAEMVSRHAAETERALAATARLSTHLRAITRVIDSSGQASSDDLFTIMEEMTMLDSPVRGTTTLLVYDDLPAAHAFLIETFGLTGGPIERSPDGTAVHAEVYAADQALWLHPSGEGYRSPRELGAVSSMVVIAVDDVDAHHERVREYGATIVAEPTDQPYGVREYGVRDLEGHLWYFHTPLEGP